MQGSHLNGYELQSKTVAIFPHSLRVYVCVCLSVLSCTNITKSADNNNNKRNDKSRTMARHRITITITITTTPRKHQICAQLNMETRPMWKVIFIQAHIIPDHNQVLLLFNANFIKA